MLGYEPIELPMEFSTWERLVHPDDFASATEALREHIAGRNPEYDRSIRMRYKDGTWRWIRTLGGISERDANGEPTRLAGMNLDIDKERRLGEQLQRKSDEMERFLYAASHDLKSPIVTVLGFLSHLERSIESGEIDNSRRFIAILQNAGQQMQSNVEDILEVSRIGRMSVHPEQIDIAEALAEVESLLSGKIRDSDAIITHEVQASTVWCDRRHIISALTNLIGNALKYAKTEQGLEITVRTRATADGGVRIDVHDNGPGVDPKFAAKIFQLFERLSSGTEGTGVGLAIVGRIAETWGGSAWLEPTKIGACFSISFSPEGVTPATNPIPKEPQHADTAKSTDYQTLLAG